MSALAKCIPSTQWATWQNLSCKRNSSTENDMETNIRLNPMSTICRRSECVPAISRRKWGPQYQDTHTLRVPPLGTTIPSNYRATNRQPSLAFSSRCAPSTITMGRFQRTVFNRTCPTKGSGRRKTCTWVINQILRHHKGHRRGSAHNTATTMPNQMVCSSLSHRIDRSRSSSSHRNSSSSNSIMDP